jgi:hypothetical protein
MWVQEIEHEQNLPVAVLALLATRTPLLPPTVMIIGTVAEEWDYFYYAREEREVRLGADAIIAGCVTTFEQPATDLTATLTVSRALAFSWGAIPPDSESEATRRLNVMSSAVNLHPLDASPFDFRSRSSTVGRFPTASLSFEFGG